MTSSASSSSTSPPPSSSSSSPPTSSLSGFHLRSIPHRHSSLTSHLSLPPSTFSPFFDPNPPSLFDTMIENCIGRLEIPLGVIPQMRMDGVSYVIPMATEEPSVIAAASSVCKLVSGMAIGGNGFHTVATENIAVGMMEIRMEKNYNSPLETPQNEISHVNQLILRLLSHLRSPSVRNEMKVHANAVSPSMTQRGKGCTDIRIIMREGISSSSLPSLRFPLLIVYIYFDVCEAMGANFINTLCEGMSEPIQNICAKFNETDTFNQFKTNNHDEDNKSALSSSSSSSSSSLPPAPSPITPQYHFYTGLQILSNFTPTRRVRSQFLLPSSSLSYKNLSGAFVMLRIVESYRLSLVDEYRTVTNNKGIMNGIDAICLACGQDQRATAAAAHCWAAMEMTREDVSHFKGKWEEIERGGEGEGKRDYGVKEEDGASSFSSSASSSPSSRSCRPIGPLAHYEIVFPSHWNEQKILQWETQTRKGKGQINGEEEGQKKEEDVETILSALPTTTSPFPFPLTEPTLHCWMEIPLSIGVVGGSIKSNPQYRSSLLIMGDPSSSILSRIICSVGLAQNFAAVRALATEGIQKGHMKLHNKKLQK